eukprot:gene19512-40558_t
MGEVLEWLKRNSLAAYADKLVENGAGPRTECVGAAPPITCPIPLHTSRPSPRDTLDLIAEADGGEVDDMITDCAMPKGHEES